MRLRIGMLGAAAAFAACGKSTEPTPTTPALGRYSYSTNLPASGELVLTYASPDSIAGYWVVAGYDSALVFGSWNVDAYLAWAHETGTPANAAHRIRTTTEGASCSMRSVSLSSGGNIISIPYSCHLAYLGP